AAIVIGLGIVGREHDRLVEVGERFLRLLARLVDEAAAEIGRRIIGIERERALIVGHGLVEASGLAIDQPAIRIGLAVIGVEADRLVEVGERFVGLAGLRQRRAAHVVGLRIVGVVLDRLRQRRDVALGGQPRRLGFGRGWRQRSQIDRAAAKRDRDQREAEWPARGGMRSSGIAT